MPDKYNTEQFQKDIAQFGIMFHGKQLEQLLIYYEMLVEWNEKMNLTAITEYEEVMKKHFVDSLSLVKAYDMGKDEFPACSLIDVGTGAGFPGMVLKIAFPEWKVTLLDSLNKRIQFLDAVIQRLELTEIRAVHGRAEDYAKEEAYREKYDLCVSRAVANLATLSEYCLPFVKEGGLFISYKSGQTEGEVKTAEQAIRILGGRIKERKEFMLPDTDISRTLIVIKKEKPTPKKYPRKAGLPSKQPIS